VFTARYVVPTQRIYAFCVDLRTNSDYFTILVFITETDFVYCAVRTLSLNKIKLIFVC
jgi:hypothetical protein